MKKSNPALNKNNGKEKLMDLWRLSHHLEKIEDR